MNKKPFPAIDWICGFNKKCFTISVNITSQYELHLFLSNENINSYRHCFSLDLKGKNDWMEKLYIRHRNKDIYAYTALFWKKKRQC